MGHPVLLSTTTVYPLLNADVIQVPFYLPLQGVQGAEQGGRLGGGGLTRVGGVPQHGATQGELVHESCL